MVCRASGETGLGRALSRAKGSEERRESHIIIKAGNRASGYVSVPVPRLVPGRQLAARHAILVPVGTCI